MCTRGTRSVLPGQSVAWNAGADGKLVSMLADAEFTTGRLSLGAGPPHWQRRPRQRLLAGVHAQQRHYRAQTSAPMPISTVGEYYQFARMGPECIVRVYVRQRLPKNGSRGGGMSWIVLAAFPKDVCSRTMSRLQGMCCLGSYYVETKDRHDDVG